MQDLGSPSVPTDGALTYVSLEVAKAATGTRIVSSALVPSPWSEAAKSLFVVAGLPAMVVARGRGDDGITAWTGADNVPVVLHGAEPPRTNWAAIVGLVARLAEPGAVLPVGARERAAAFGLLETIAGEDGLGWCSRLAMIQSGIETNGERGFPLPIATYLAARYGLAPTITTAALRERIGERLSLLRERLAESGGDYFLGQRVSALDVYTASFLTPLANLDDACPQMTSIVRRAFGTARELFADLVPEALWAHRRRMFERHLAFPIRLS